VKTLATENHPIRASMLPYLFSCPRMFMERFKSDGNLIDDVAANTGSMVHAGIEWFHKKDITAGMKAIDASREKYPAGDIEEAKTLLRKYVERHKSDPRGKIIASEVLLKVEIPCAAFDETKQKILITGTVDQIRRVGDEIWVVDHKSGRRSGADMCDYYAPQIAAYMLMAAVHLGTLEPVKGYITRLQDLKRSDYKFWWELEFGLSDCLAILAPVQSRIAELRMGRMDSTPNKNCDYCAVKPYPNCVTGREAPLRDATPAPKKIPLTAAQLWGKTS